MQAAIQSERDRTEKLLAEAAESLGYPLFVKPLRAGSSFGVSEVAGLEDLPAAVEAAFRHDSRILLEAAVPGFEVGCSVLGNPGETALTVGVVDEIELGRGFFNYNEKYTLETSAIHCPARIPAAIMTMDTLKYFPVNRSTV